MPKQFARSLTGKLWPTSLLLLLSASTYVGAASAPAIPVYPDYAVEDSVRAVQGASADETAVRGAYGSKSSMQQNAINPFVGNNQNLHTLDGTKQGNIAMATPSSNAFVTLAVSPPTSAGDIATIAVKQDLLDGSPTLTMAKPAAPFGVVSGICANGVISCAAGTFSGCNYYLWDAPGGKIQLTKAVLTDMAGCYGINSASGSSPAIINLDSIVRDLGAGAVASVMKYSPRYTISGTDANAGSISYFGRIVESTSSVPGYAPGTVLKEGTIPVTKASSWDSGGAMSNPPMSGTPLPGKYTFNTNTLGPDSDAEIQAQAANPNSYLSMFQNSAAAANSLTKAVQCTMNNQIKIEPGVNFCDEPPPSTMLREVQFTQYYKVRKETITTGGDGDNNRPVPPQYPSGFVLSQILAPITVSESGILGIPHAYAYPSIGALVLEDQYSPWKCDDCGAFCGDYTCYNSDRNQYYSQCTRTYDNQVTTQVNSTPSCAVLDTTSGCSITDEIVDGVVVMQSGVHKFTPAAGCYKTVLSSTGLEYKIPLPWCQKTRTYMCPNTAPSFDLSGLDRMKAASATANLSVTGGNYQMDYTDKRQNSDGTWTSTSQNAVLGTVNTDGSCEKMCKVSRPAVNTSVGFNGAANETLVDITSIDTIYNSCSPTCETLPGDTIIQDCACLDTFSDAVVAISILQQAKIESICSSTP